MSVQTTCSGCGAAVFEKDTIDGTTGATTKQLVNAGDGKFHVCPSAKPAAKPAAPKAKAAAKPATPAAAVKPASPAPAPALDAAKPGLTPEQLANRQKVAEESNEVICETAIDIMAGGMKMTYEAMNTTVTKRMMNDGVSRLQAIKNLAKDLNIDIEKQGAPVSKAASDLLPPNPTFMPPEDYQTEQAPPDAPETALAVTSHGDDNVAISEYTDDELERGVEVDFDTWAATASRSLLSVEKATKENLVLKFIKGGKVVKRRSKFEQEVRDKDNNVVFELDNENKPIMEADGKGGFKPKVKKQRPIQDWVPVTDKAGVEYLLNVNPGMRKMLGKFKNDAGGTFDCWFRLKGEGRGKAYTCVITPVKDEVKK